MDIERIQDYFLDECRREFRECYAVLKDRRIVLFGAGSYGKMMVQAFDDIGMKENIIAICDNYKKDIDLLENIPVLNIDDVEKEKNDFVVVISSQFEEEIRDSLSKFHGKYLRSRFTSLLWSKC